MEAIQRYLPNNFRIEPSDSGIHIVCWLPDILKEQDIIDKCRKIGLGAQPLSRYCQTNSAGHAILLGFAAHSPAEIVAGIQRLGQIIA